METQHADRVNRVLAAIDASLGEKLSLEKLAEVGSFSPFHFHRVFSSALGETLHAYILRKRLQRAAGMLVHRPDLDVTAIAMESGFSTPSDFSRAFRKGFGESPKAYRASGGFRLGAKDFQVAQRGEEAEAARDAPELARMEDLRIASITCIGVSFGMDSPKILRAFTRLYRWAKDSGMAQGDMRFVGLLRDEPEIAPVERIRYCAGIVLDGKLEGRGRLPGEAEIGVAKLSGDCLRLRFDRSDPEFARRYLDSLRWAFKRWMPARSLAPDDRPIAEVYSMGSDGRSLVEVNVPVRPF